MSYLSRRDLEDIRPSLDKIVYKLLGSSDNSVLSTIESNLYNGFDRRKLIDKLSPLLDGKKASRLSDKVEDLVDGLKSSSHRLKKRVHEDDSRERDTKKVKTRYDDDNKKPTEEKHRKEGNGNAGGSDKLDETSKDDNNSKNFSSNQIKMMMENAQKEIEERKKKLESIKATKAPPASAVAAAAAVTAKISAAATVASSAQPPALDIDRSRKIAQLQEQIRAKLSGTLATVLPPVVQDKPKPLILDAEGRTVDGSGQAVEVPKLTPTLKANIRAKKRETTKIHQAEKQLQEESAEAHFFDDRITVKPAVRNKRALRFHEPGKFQQLAERLRMKTQLEKLQNEISQIARKTGISSATKLALIAPKADTHSNEVPQMEWWDSVILTDDLNTLDKTGRIAIRESAITNLIEHPTQMRPPNESSRPVYLPVFLTKKERKKLRRQNRREAWKEEQEKIRLGLEPPPEPKLRISNLMRVLGTEAVQDPTKIEAHVREQMAKRQKAHEEANAARKLTDDQRRDKKVRKMKEDTSLGVHVSVYRIRDLHDQQSKKFKVETNAKQLFMTGVCVLFRDCCAVVVEGGPKQQKKYKRLLLHRIKWEEDLVKNADGNEVPNSCVLVWEGTAQRRYFGEFKYKSFTMEKGAREFFQKHHVEHYWDLAYSGAVLEASEDT
ncbi:U4/U6 small nuclear ribonucleoprotein Prp3 [Toxorhynchites rutilus septentrionalis]|uniref:U4/U6 small nuclear ribonucleoprotein Prp3 n=1 Tax=Toxorhynchites rutilus septentrionalis TaxID=329112 RepID=UPI00247A5C2C|nr:U4/U6 small nuclear ribonucleoprotein Prp3 [Toxorhynchites rutilus septentrionalis]